jgi:ubiquinol-cytochrome c reductase cytochrome b subunit
VLAFFGSIGAAFTGYLSQSNFDSQWISTQAKDGLNAAGIGAFFNVLNSGQMLLWHVALLPMVVGAIVVLHILLIRRHGVVPPIANDEVLTAQAPSIVPGGRGPAPEASAALPHQPVPTASQPSTGGPS